MYVYMRFDVFMFQSVYDSVFVRCFVMYVSSCTFREMRFVVYVSSCMFRNVCFIVCFIECIP